LEGVELVRQLYLDQPPLGFGTFQHGPAFIRQRQMQLLVDNVLVPGLAVELDHFDAVQRRLVVAPSCDLEPSQLVVEEHRVALPAPVQRRKLEPLVQLHVLEPTFVSDVTFVLSPRRQNNSIFAYVLDLVVFEPERVNHLVDLLLGKETRVILANFGGVFFQTSDLDSIPDFECAGVFESFGVGGAAHDLHRVSALVHANGGKVVEFGVF